MSYIQELLVLAIYSFCTTLLLIQILIYFLPNIGLVDKPGIRRIHTKITPRGGGIAIVIVLILGIAIFYAEYLKLIPMILMVSGISLLDDVKGVIIPIRLIVHFTASALAVYKYFDSALLFHGELPQYIDFTIAILGLVGFLNIYNFLDGIDGITSIETIHLSLVMIALCYLKFDIIHYANIITSIAIILLASSTGFLIFNWHPAKIFLGDVGSISLGFVIGLCLLLIASSSSRLFASCAIASLYYLADGGITILIRFLNGEKIWEPHLKHFFQKAMRSGMNHTEVVIKIAFCNIVLLSLSISALYFPALSIILAVMSVLILLIHFHYYQPSKSTKKS